MELKDRIRKLRTDAGLSTTALASKFDKSEAAVRAWEGGRTKPDADGLIQISKYFDCSVDYLLGLSEYKTATERERLFESITDEESQVIVTSPDFVECLSGLVTRLRKLPEKEQGDILEFINYYTSHEYTNTDRGVIFALLKGATTLSFAPRKD